MCGATRTLNKEHKMDVDKKTGKIKPGKFADQKVTVEKAELNVARARTENKGKKQVTIQLKKAR